MAEESGKPSSASEIDLDNIEVDVLIICKNQNALNQSSSFLTRRGWPTTVVTDISRAIELIADQRPDFVLVSLSHPSPSINKLPDLITQTFNIHCVGYVETSDASSSARLAQAKMRYKIQGQPSGPAIHRTLRKILAERFHIENMEETAAASAADAEEMKRFSGGGTAADGGVIIQKAAQGHSNKGALVFRGENPTEASGVEEGPTAKFFQGKEGSVSEDVDQDEIDALLSGTPLNKPKKARRSLKQIEGKADDKSGDMLFGQTLEKNRAPHVTRMPTADLVAEVKKSLFGEGGEDITAFIPAPEAAEEPRPRVNRASQSILEKAVDGAMGRLCQSIPGVIPIGLEEIGHVGVCPFDSPTQSGYLVIVWQAPEQIVREEFLRSCERELQNAFAAMNVQGKLESSFWLQLPAAQWADLVNSHAQFNIVMAHQKREVGVAFFPIEGQLVKPEPPAGAHGMYSVKVDNISTEFPVNFKAFIHFVNNNRFFLYLRNGRVLQPEQKKRLLEHKMEEFFMKSHDVENVRQHMAFSHLGTLIKRLKKAA